MNNSVRKPSMGSTSVSSSISGRESIGDILRKARKELLLKRISLALLLVVLAALVVYLFVAGYITGFIDASFALID